MVRVSTGRMVPISTTSAYARAVGLFSWRKKEATKPRTFYYWRCECGATSRGGDTWEQRMHQLAWQHQWRNGVSHPLPEVYSEVVQVPSDSP